jgi:hypothetical protein
MLCAASFRTFAFYQMGTGQNFENASHPGEISRVVRDPLVPGA